MDKFFKISARGSTVPTEIIGGLTTFLAMSYIIAVNPAMMQAAGMPFNAALTATCVGAAIMTIAMGVFANRPIALASGMGINAVVAYSLCLGLGVDWRVAMGVIFLEGIVMFAVLYLLSRRMPPRPRGTFLGLFLIMYGCFRFLMEFVREPDVQLGYLWGGWLTMGQLLSVPLVLVGVGVFVYALVVKKPQKGLPEMQQSE